MAAGTLIQVRSVCTSAALHGKRNFRKFSFPNKRGSLTYKRSLLQEGLVDHRGLRTPQVVVGEKTLFVPEMIPELIVPDLAQCKLQPYVSYRAPEVVQSEFTAKDLFDAVYSEKIIKDFKSDKLDANGNPLEPSPEEKLTPQEAKINARKSGSDIFGFNPTYPSV